MRKQTGGISHTLALGAATTVAAASLLFVSFGNHKAIQTPAYEVKHVVDGDSFFLTNGLEIRLANIDAPELQFCGGPEAKKKLEALVLGKPIYIHIIVADSYHRLVSMVYANSTFVNAEMLRAGMATYPSSTTGYTDQLRTAIDDARNHMRGIHGPPCTQKINTDHPTCDIKGNIFDGNHYYYTKDCPWYDQPYVQLYRGEQWFCSEDEAIAAGYVPAPRCRK